MGEGMKFRVIDKQTGVKPNLWNVAIGEPWTELALLVRRDDTGNLPMAGFAITERGSLILLDKYGNYAVCPKGRFEVK